MLPTSDRDELDVSVTLPWDRSADGANTPLMFSSALCSNPSRDLEPQAYLSGLFLVRTSRINEIRGLCASA
jgi:hypothetical protein